MRPSKFERSELLTSTVVKVNIHIPRQDKCNNCNVRRFDHKGLRQVQNSFALVLLYL